MLKEINYDKYIKKVMEQLPKGVFMNVMTSDKMNTMTMCGANQWMVSVQQVLCHFCKAGHFEPVFR